MNTDSLRLFGVRDVADRLGESEMTVRRLINKGQLVAVRGDGSRKLKITAAALQDYIDSLPEA